MADPITNTAAASSLLRAQQLQQLQTPSTQSSQSFAQALQLHKTHVPVKASAVTLSSKSLGPSGNLPRGSIVDKLV